MKAHEIGQREVVVDGKPATIHVYEPKPRKDKEVMTTRDDSSKSIQQWMREHR